MLKTFPKGGVHPEENKFSARKPIETIELPKQVRIPASQHIGAPAEPIVKVGDEIKVGQLIAKSTGFVSANIHSSVSGKVASLDKLLHASGHKLISVIIDVIGDEWLETIDKTDTLITEKDISAEEVRNIITDSGIVGLGGATFPSHVKMMIPQGKTCEYLVINAVECEPYLTADHQLMLEKSEEIIIGSKLMAKGAGASKIIIGIENNKPDAIEKMQAAAAKHSKEMSIEVCALKVMYPQGGEKQLIKAVLNRDVPSGKLPIDVGCVVQNVGTTFAAYEAIMKNKPLFERVVTITGKSVKNPKNIRSRIGTPIDMLIEAVGGLPEDTGKIVNGGPMMGKAIKATGITVTKGTSAILIFPEEEAARPETHNCIRCGRCVSACPMGLEPYLIKNMTAINMIEELEAQNVTDCIECGSCAYICPASVPLLDYIRLGKGNLIQILRKKSQ